MGPGLLLGTKSAWPNFPDTNRFSRVDVAVDHTVGDPAYEQRHQITMIQRPLNLRFACSRQFDAIDPRMVGIYHQAIQGGAHRSLTHSDATCSAGKVSKHCGNSRGHLYECACETLNRTSYPRLRHQYEDMVINKALGIVREDRHLRSLNIAIFASGGLHGEFVLMARLIDQLKKAGFHGTIQLFLIDREYSQHIENAFYFNPSAHPNGFQWSEFLGGRQDLAQFLSEISLCLPTTIEVNGAVFGDASDYIARASKDSNFRHDLLIGADIENSGTIVSQLKQEAQRRNEPGIVLVKENNKPKICEVKPISGQFVCRAI